MHCNYLTSFTPDNTNQNKKELEERERERGVDHSTYHESTRYYHWVEVVRSTFVISTTRTIERDGQFKIETLQVVALLAFSRPWRGESTQTAEDQTTKHHNST